MQTDVSSGSDIIHVETGLIGGPSFRWGGAHLLIAVEGTEILFACDTVLEADPFIQDLTRLPPRKRFTVELADAICCTVPGAVPPLSLSDRFRILWRRAV